MGNPSDGYGGKAIAVAIENFRARATVESHDRLVLVGTGGNTLTLDSLDEAAEPFEHADGDGGLRLLRAALRRFLLRAPATSRDRFLLRFDTDIPRQVGLSGSSAIIIAAIRALARWFDESIEPATIAEMALAAELDDLGIACGPMDRVIQAYGGLVAMDLREPRSSDSYARLDPASLPPLFVAFDRRGGQPSGRAHASVRARWERGDVEILSIMETFRGFVDAAVDALGSGDHERFAELMDRNFDLRCRFFPVSERDREMVAVARRFAASAKLCGSGGAIVGQPGARTDVAGLRREYARREFELIEPHVAAPTAQT